MLYKVNIQEIKSLSHDLVVEAESIEKLVFYTYEGDQIITKKSAINIWKICKSGSSLLHPFFCCF